MSPESPSIATGTARNKENGMDRIDGLRAYAGDKLEGVLSGCAGAEGGRAHPFRVASGLASLDEALAGGFTRGEVSCFLSLPGAGARDMALQSAVGAAACGAKVRAYFPGMGPAEAAARVLCVLTGISLSEAHAVLLSDEGRPFSFDETGCLDLEVSPALPTVAELDEVAREADLVVVDAVGSLASRESHPSLSLRKLARASTAAFVAVDALRDGFRLRESGARYKDRDPRSRYDVAILIDRSLTEAEAERCLRPGPCEVDLVIEDRMRKMICFGLRLAFSPRCPCFFKWVPDEEEAMLVKWYPSSPSPWKAWLDELHEARRSARELCEWERELDRVLLERYAEAVEIEAERERAIAESTDYID